MASHQRVLPLSSSNAFASCTDLGVLTPKLCIRTQYFDFRFPMMWLRFTSTCRIHHENAGLPAVWSCNAYSSIKTLYELFISFRITHVLLPYFHCMRTSTPFLISMRFLVPVRVVMNASYSFTSVPSYLCSIISWNMT